MRWSRAILDVLQTYRRKSCAVLCQGLGSLNWRLLKYQEVQGSVSRFSVSLYLQRDLRLPPSMFKWPEAHHTLPRYF